ncbi:MAG: phosphate ABC transporter, permease protein PstA [SAR116 cluster bacterium]|nr:phosphate ABC transporter, permease protein PstA [SAR116 cluster bacterium]RPH12217.1 MAG: phosphate ABC transporter permease PstA [Alphaproteobacteria bacterium TMED54]|tara:strand:+ start:2498 stop:3802 length:1305 start_codon:yes stop_codon:yes gene_type:complete
MNNNKPKKLTANEASMIVESSVIKRRKKDARLKTYGRIAIGLAVSFLIFLFVSIFSKGIPGFFQYYVTLDVYLDRDRLDPKGDLSPESLYNGDARSIVLESLYKVINPKGRKEKKAAKKIISTNADVRISKMVLDDPNILGKTIPITFAVDDDIDSFLRGYIKRETPSSERRINDTVIKFVDKLSAENKISYKFSDYILTGSASRSPEIAGIKGAFIGSMLTLAVCFIIAFPLGVATAVYLEEFAPKNRITEIIEVNINNLAAVPSVVFGILGLAIFIGVFGMPRSIPLLGGMVLALMTLPTIIISSRAAIRAVPPSIKDAAYGIGASKLQTIFHHVLPLAMPGMLTGTIIGMAQALGETAPLLMIGMVAFIVDIPGGVTDPGTVLPVQIFMWADFAERMFIQKTSSAIIVLLVFLIFMNAAAVILRKKLERRW